MVEIAAVLVLPVGEARDEPGDLGKAALARVVEKPPRLPLVRWLWAKRFQKTKTLSVFPKGTESQFML
jgi:hypothetical protein